MPTGGSFCLCFHLVSSVSLWVSLSSFFIHFKKVSFKEFVLISSAVSRRHELISYILWWTSSHRQAKAGWPARTYIQQLCADTGCSLEDLPGATDDRGGRRERVRDIRADGSTWWLSYKEDSLIISSFD